MSHVPRIAAAETEKLAPATHTYTITIPDDVNRILVAYARQERQRPEVIAAEAIRAYLGLTA